MLIRDETIGEFLDRLAERVPAPGGGAAAALSGRPGCGPAGHGRQIHHRGAGTRRAQPTIGRIITEADELRMLALRLAEADADAFTAVADAYQLPKSTEEQQATRSAAIGGALVNAAWPPAR